MKKTFTRVSLLIIISFLFHFSSISQDLTGIWRGYFITETGEQYKFELQVEHNKTNSISGVSYSYLSTVFYGKAILTGRFNKDSKNALVQEIKTVELRMSGGSVACIMKCQMEYAKSGREEFLEGTFTSKYEKTDSIRGDFRGGNCGDGRVYLRKVITSDFYIEPFLREKVNVNKNIPPKVPVKKTTPLNTTTKTIPKPLTKNTSTAKNNNTPTRTTKPVNQNNRTLTKTPDKLKTDSARTIENQIEINDPSKRVITQIIPPILKSRSNELVKTIPVSNEEIIVKLYDNGEIDDDTISVYMDRKLILSKQRLSEKPLILTLKMDADNPEHNLVMVADNLGRIPPNTSLMIVQDGEKRYEVRITSTEQKNAMVRFRYQKNQ